LTLATQKGIDINFTSAELTMSLDDFSERILKPAMARLASEIDKLGCALFADVYQLVGTPGTTPSDALTVLYAGQKLDEMAAPRDGLRAIVYNPAAMAKTVDGLKGLFHSAREISDQYKRGLVVDSLGFTFAMDQNINILTCGTRSGTILTNGAATEGDTTISLDGFGGATQTVVAGDVFTLAGIYAVNPETGMSTGALQQFVCTQTTAASGSAIAALPISPSLITVAPKATVSALPGDGVAVTFVGTASTAYPQNLAFHRDAFCLASADLEMPKGVDFAAREVYDGISMRIVRAYDINNDQFPCRIDTYLGWKTIRPELACRIIG